MKPARESLSNSPDKDYFPSRPFMISLMRLNIGVISAYLGSETSKSFSREHAIDRQEHVFRDIDAPGIGRIFAVEVVIFLHCDLAAARKEPIDENFCRVGIRRAFDQAHRAAAGRHLTAFFPVDHIEFVDRQSLNLARAVSRQPTHSANFPCEPIRYLSSVPAESRLHIGE